ncbi:MAG TPA: RluA family pseudouridine synthase [Candidatus Mediterraneibacter gallistercoris]|uniref:Pseudouridine synthase n=1 Tax=Candidatus Mediterraneibacter gallistercoris TaxID=2838671 RepID=A0A9D2P4D7_9FIRM|nr:RluA family pseudouridine synthase [Candidatus Mediterraneibacter gallistercoris]
MERIITYTIDSASAGLRIEQYLRRRGYSYQNLTQLKKMRESILINGVWSYMRTAVKNGDILTVHIQEPESSPNIPPVKLPLDIVYEDEDIVVVNKPAGMPVHPSLNNYENSLANGLMYYYQEQGKPFIFRCTNRLDRDTSGLTVVAKHMVSSSILSSMGMRHEITREYLAIVRGALNPSEGTIDAPIGRTGSSLIERKIDFENGERAVTHYRVVEEQNGHSLVSLILETGRTHQIRVHMKYIGHPLVGDYLYNPDMEYIDRQALHSHRLSFTHPVTGEKMEFTAPLPTDMRKILSG